MVQIEEKRNTITTIVEITLGSYIERIFSNWLHQAHTRLCFFL